MHIGAIDREEFDGESVEYYRVEPGGEIVVEPGGSRDLT
jgi:hypothetical protein